MSHAVGAAAIALVETAAHAAAWVMKDYWSTQIQSFMLTQPWFAAALTITGAIAGATPASSVMASVSPTQLEQRGWQAYKLDSFGKAVELWQQAAQSYLMEQDPLGQARVMGSISLAHQRLGDWEEARHSLETGHSLLKISTQIYRSQYSKAHLDSAKPSESPHQPMPGQKVPEQEVPEQEVPEQKVLGQLLETEAQLYRATGRTQREQERWQEAAAIYQALGQVKAQRRCQLFQIQAQQHLGKPAIALEQLADLQAQSQSDKNQSDASSSQFQARIQQQQAIAHWQRGNLPQAQQLLENLLENLLETGTTHPNLQAQVHLLLGHLYQLQAQPTSAIHAYQRAAQTSQYKTQALESLLHLSLNPSYLHEAPQWEPLWDELEQQWKQTSPNQIQLHRRMGVIQHLTQGHLLSPEQLSTLEALAYDNIQRAYSLGEVGSPNTAAITEAIITLAQVHRAAGEPDKARSLLEEAERTAPNSMELRYRTQSQRAQLQLQGLMNQLELNQSELNQSEQNPLEPDLLESDPLEQDRQMEVESVLQSLQQAHQRLQQGWARDSSWGGEFWGEVRSQTALKTMEAQYDQLREQLAQPQPEPQLLGAIALQIQAIEQKWQLQTRAWRHADLD